MAMTMMNKNGSRNNDYHVGGGDDNNTSPMIRPKDSHRSTSSSSTSPRTNPTTTTNNTRATTKSNNTNKRMVATKKRNRSTSVLAGVSCVLFGVSCISLYTDSSKLLLISTALSSSSSSSHHSSYEAGAASSHDCSSTMTVPSSSSSSSSYLVGSHHYHYQDNEKNEYDNNATTTTSSLPFHHRSSSYQAQQQQQQQFLAQHTIDGNNMHDVYDDYTWIGNHWIPPYGIPTYTPTQMKQFFATQNILWLGDSTCRRTFLTSHGILQNQNHHEHGDGSEQQQEHDNVPISNIDGYNVIDINKQTYKLPFEQCTDRTFYPIDQSSGKNNNNNNTSSSSSSSILVRNRYEQHQSKENRNVYLCRNVNNIIDNDVDVGRTTSSSATTTTTTNSDGGNKGKGGKFDYGNILCGHELLDFVNIELNPQSQHVAISHEYDVIVVAFGIWEIIRSTNCKMNVQDLITFTPTSSSNQGGPNNNNNNNLRNSQQYPQTPLGHALACIDALQRLILYHQIHYNRTLRVVWRTSGYIGDGFNYDKAYAAAEAKKAKEDKAAAANNNNDGGVGGGFFDSILSTFGGGSGSDNNDNENQNARSSSTGGARRALRRSPPIVKDKQGKPSKKLQDFMKLLDLDNAQQLLHDSGTQLIDEMNSGVIEHIENQKNRMQGPHLLSYIDYGKVIKPRSFYPNRILGDMDAHYGLEARTLFLQMLTHELLTSSSTSTTS